MAISMVGASIIWKFVYDYRHGRRDHQIGLLNQILVWLGFDPYQFLLDRTVEHLLPDRRDDLDPGRVRDDGAVGGDQGDPRRHRRGRAASTASPGSSCSARSPCRASGRRWSSCSPRSRIALAEGLRHRPDHDRRQLRHPRRRQRVLHPDVPPGQPGVGIGAALAVVLFVLVIPIIVYNVRQMRLPEEMR